MPACNGVATRISSGSPSFKAGGGRMRPPQPHRGLRQQRPAMSTVLVVCAGGRCRQPRPIPLCTTWKRVPSFFEAVCHGSVWWPWQLPAAAARVFCRPTRWTVPPSRVSRESTCGFIHVISCLPSRLGLRTDADGRTRKSEFQKTE
jgi:hypothetical protein